jgi:Asp-tRNA(Asn)/Glu-tRNA(Gln) amidotransferase A subunit family amidase
VADADEITARTLAAAEALSGEALGDAERAAVLPLVASLWRRWAARRSVALGNALPPAAHFSPLGAPPAADAAAPAEHAGRESTPRETAPAVPETDAELAFASLRALARAQAEGAVTSVRLTELALARLRAHGPTLACVVSLCEARALETAARADHERAAGRVRGPLHGIPWGAKDLLDTAGTPTTFGAGPFRGRVPASDAEVVRRLEAAGAVLVAKLSLGELAYGDVWFGGATRNPWRPDTPSGGSSAGSAASVVAGLVPFSIGSETLGSITTPCATCGATGLRPTFGRVARTGALAVAWSLDKLGPIARGVDDVARVFAAIHGADGVDPDAVSAPFAFDPAAPVAGRRVGFAPAWFEAASPAERGALDALRGRGVELVEIVLPGLPYDALLTVLQVEAAAAFEELLADGRDAALRRQDALAWPNLLRLARFVPAVEYVQAQRVRRRAMEIAQALFRDLDAVAAPGPGGAMLLVSNATGHPALTLPVGFGSDGLPAAVTLHGRLYDEAGLCALGLAVERALGASSRRPPGFASR